MRKKGPYQHPTLCFYCQKATTSGCSWSKSLKPVKGWRAKKTSVGVRVYQTGVGLRTVPADSYDVYRCPEFVEHELCKTDPVWIKELAKCLSFKEE